MTPDPKLVEALADLLRTAGDEPLWWPYDVARRFVTRYRLVQLPEEPSGWASCEAVRRLEKKGMTTMWISTRPHPSSEAGPDRLVYIIPGDPQEVEP